MGVGAVAEVGEHVLLAGERLLAEPHRALAAHVRDGRRLHRAHEHRHRVAADAGQRPAAFGHAGRAVVRAAGAKARAAQRRRAIAERLRRRLRRAQRAIGIVAAQRPGDHLRDEFRRRLAEIGNGRRRRGPDRRRAPSKYLPTMRGAFAPAIEDRADLILEQRALLLDDDDEIEPLREIAHDDRVERPHHADLEQAEAGSGRRRRDCRAPAGDPARPCRPRRRRRAASSVADDAVEAVGARVGERRRAACARRAAPPAASGMSIARAPKPPGGLLGRFGNDDRGRIRADIDRAAASATSVTIFMPIQQPEKRDIAIPCRPKSISSWVFDG